MVVAMAAAGVEEIAASGLVTAATT